MEAKDLIKSGLNISRGMLYMALDTLTTDELKWQPCPDANSIGMILFHMTRSEDSMIHVILQKKMQVWELEKWYENLGKDKKDQGSHYTREQVAAFVVPDIKDLMAYAKTVRKSTLEYVESMTPEKLDEKIEFPHMGSPTSSSSGDQPKPVKLPFEATVGSMLMLTIAHISEHAGDISYIRGLQRGMGK